MLNRTPRVAVIGAGMTGASFIDAMRAFMSRDPKNRGAVECHMFEMGAGAGGRCSTRHGARHGTPAFSISKTDQSSGNIFASVVQDYVSRGLVEQWDSASLGVIDKKKLDQGAAVASNFIPKGKYTLYKPRPNMFPELLKSADLHFRSCVHQITRNVSQNDEEKWLLQGRDDEVIGHKEGYDWIVVTSLAAASHERWSSTFGGAPPLANLHKTLQRIVDDDDVHEFSSTVLAKKHSSTSASCNPSKSMDVSTVNTADASKALEVLNSMNRIEVRPVLTSINIFEASSPVGLALRESFPFDLAHVDADPVIRKIVMDTFSDENTGDKLCIVAHSTETYAKNLGNLRSSNSSVSRISSFGSSSETKQTAASDEMEKALSQILEKWVPKFSLCTRNGLAYKAVHRWGSAFPVPNSYFLDDSKGSLSHVMPSMGLAICGDYMGCGASIGKVEAAVLSGIDAANQIIMTLDVGQ